jgi:streptogramin lyase
MAKLHEICILGLFMIIVLVSASQFFNLKSSSSSLSSMLSLFIPAAAIPADQMRVVLSTWALPTYSKDISNVISDFAGNAYFSESTINKIGRLEPPRNMITEWRLPTNSSIPTGVAFDPTSGSIYFSETGSNKIGRLNPTINIITEWRLPTNSSRPTGVAFDPTSKSIYFAESGTNKIGRLEPATNVITEWAIGSNPLAISVTPGGSCFFIDEIGRIGRLG